MSEAGEPKTVPNLRFPEFSGKWEEVRLGSRFPQIRNGFVGTATPFYEIGGIPYLQGKNIKSGRIDPTGLVEISRGFHAKQKKSQLRVGDILMVQSGHVGECAVVQNDFNGANCHALIVLTPQNGQDSRWYKSYFYADSGKRKIHRFKTGNTVEHILTSDLKPMTLSVPQSIEQEKIADFLEAVDARIGLLRRRRDGLAAYKKATMQRLFARTLRFTNPDGFPFPDWKEKRLAEVLTEHGERSTGNERVHSVSVHKGVIDQIEHLGRSFSAANTDHYNLVKPGDVIYTKSPTGDFPMGIVKQNRLAEDVIVSPLYGVFTPETFALGYILNEHFLSAMNTHNYLHQLVQKGAKNTINISNNGFLQGRLTLPVHPEEQQKIADFLIALDAKIYAVAAQIDAMQRFKQGLLQQMFV